VLLQTFKPALSDSD